jgi:hypothetical protein
MEYFKNWIVSLCGAGIITSVFQIIVSNSKVKKSVNIFLSLFVFLYTIIPIENLFSNIELKIENEYETSSYTDIYKNGYENILIQSIENICEENDVQIIYINLDSHLDGDGYLVVNNIEIQLNNNDKKEIIKNEINKQFNYEVIFI